MTIQQTLPRPAPPPPAPPAAPRPHRSVLGRIVVFASVLALGVLGMVDLSGASVAGSAYLAMVLAIVGAGLLAGAWYGRARWLIAVGAGVTMLLLPTVAADRAGPAGSTTWRPTGIQQLDPDYRAGIGNAVLDLSAVDFTGQEKALRVQVDIGDLQVILPADVDTVVDADVSTGNAHVFGTTWGGLNQQPRTITDNGDDGPGGGTLTLHTKVGMGNLEVRR